MILATFEIRKARKAVGRVEVRDEADLPKDFGVYFYLGDRPRGFTKIARRHGTAIAIGATIRMTHQFAHQNGCKYVSRPGHDTKLRPVRPHYEPVY